MGFSDLPPTPHSLLPPEATEYLASISEAPKQPSTSVGGEVEGEVPLQLRAPLHREVPLFSLSMQREEGGGPQ